MSCCTLARTASRRRKSRRRGSAWRSPPSRRELGRRSTITADVVGEGAALVLVEQLAQRGVDGAAARWPITTARRVLKAAAAGTTLPTSGATTVPDPDDDRSPAWSKMSSDGARSPSS